MPMKISNVVATTYMDVNRTGRNRPCTFSCVNENNQSEDYVVKFHGVLGSSIIFELYASILGRALGILVPDFAIVHIDPRMQAAIQDRIARENFQKSPGPHFGSQHLGNGYTVLNKGYTITNNESVLEQALNVFAFDMLIQNSDRRSEGTVGNPNILFKGNEIVAIDHELSFSFVNLIGSPTDPWDIRSTNLPYKHIFYRQLSKYANNHTISFDGFIEKLVQLTPEYIESIGQAVPSEWYNERYIAKITQHLEHLRENAEMFRKGLLEVFA